MTLFYAATQHFRASLPIIVQVGGALGVFTIDAGSLLLAKAV
jgi:hypothetical protein